MRDNRLPPSAEKSSEQPRPCEIASVVGMSDLTTEDVSKFADLWEKEYGVRLSNDEAKERAEKLVRFVLLMQRMGS